MDLSLGTSNIPSVAAEATFGQGMGAQALPGPASPRSTALAAQLAQQVLMPSSFAQIQIACISVARRLVPPVRDTQAERDERKKGEFLRRLKILKSEASGQQSRGK